MGRNLLAGLVAMAVVGLLFGLSSRQAPKKLKGVRTLAWPAPLRWFVLFMLPASAGIAWMAAQAKPDQIVMATIVSGGFLVGSVYLAYCIFLYRVWWTTEGIGSWHPIGGGRFVRWDAVEEVAYLASVQAFYVKGGGTRVWYSPMQSGIGQLNRYIERRLGPVMGGRDAWSGDAAS